MTKQSPPPKRAKQKTTTAVRAASATVTTSDEPHAPKPMRKFLNLSPRTFAIIVIITGVIGLIASFVLTVDKIHVLKDPSYSPACNINPIFSCGSVMKSKQAEVLGAPNTVFGLVGFAAVVTVGFAILAGAKLQAWFWRLWMVGMLFGTGGLMYLFFQSVFRLKTLCVYCMSTWAALLPLIWYSLLWCLERGYVPTPQRLRKVVDFMRSEHLSILVGVYLAIIVTIVHQFWYFFKTL